MLCSMESLKTMYKAQHRPLESLSETAQKLYAVIRQNPVSNSELKQLTGMTGKTSKSVYDRAMVELQVTFQIVRVNQSQSEGDTWTPFVAPW